MKESLFVLKHDFADVQYAGRKFYCRECIEVHGLLSAFPKLRELLDIHVVDFARPRLAIVQAVGSDAHQNCPMLMVGSTLPIEGVTYLNVNNKLIVNGAKQIGLYLATKYGISAPHP